jgi:hypothetical protein
VSAKLRILLALGAVIAASLTVSCGSGGRVDAEPGGKDNRVSVEHTGQWRGLAKADEGWYRPEGIFWDGGHLLVVAASTIMAWDPGRSRVQPG